MTDVASQVSQGADAAANSRPMGWLARLGLTARGVVYLVMGWLAILLATGDHHPVDQRGVITTLISQPFGTVLVIVLAVGLAAYALWRLVEVVAGPSGERDTWGARLKSLVRAIAYGVLAFTAVSVLHGARQTQAGQQGRIAAHVMSQPGGRWLVGGAGVAVVAVGVSMVIEGWSKKFLRYFGYLPPRARGAVVLLGRVGTIARGLVFAVTGALVVQAALDANPAKAGGIDTATRTLLDQPYGAWLVLALGAGLMLFGVYALAEARWRRVSDEDVR